MDNKRISTAMDIHRKMTKEMEKETDPEDMKNIPNRELIGILIYSANWIRPELSFCVGALSRFSAHPKKEHWKAAKGILKCGKTTNRACRRRLGRKFGQQKVDIRICIPSGMKPDKLAGQEKSQSHSTRKPMSLFKGGEGSNIPEEPTEGFESQIVRQILTISYRDIRSAVFFSKRTHIGIMHRFTQVVTENTIAIEWKMSGGNAKEKTLDRISRLSYHAGGGVLECEGYQRIKCKEQWARCTPTVNNFMLWRLSGD